MDKKSVKNGLTRDEYIEIKTLLSVPLSSAEIERRTKRSWPTIRNIRDSKTYEEYFELGRKSKEKPALQEKIESKKTEEETVPNPVPVEETSVTEVPEPTPVNATQMVFGERQAPEDNTVEKVEENKPEMTKFDELMALEKELLVVNKEILACEKEVVAKMTSLMESLGVNTEAIKDLTVAIRE
jgi:hypothetical protein